MEGSFQCITRRPAPVLWHSALRRLLLLFAQLCVVLMQKLIECQRPVVKSQEGRLKHTSTQSSNTKFTRILGSCGMQLLVAALPIQKFFVGVCLLLRSFQRFRVQILFDPGHVVLRSINLHRFCTYEHLEYLDRSKSFTGLPVRN